MNFLNLANDLSAPNTNLFVATESGIQHDDYLQQLSLGGAPSITLCDLFSKPLGLLTLFPQK